jgi:hypothetical protein
LLRGYALQETSGVAGFDPSTRCVRAVAAICASHVRRVFSCTWQAPMRDVS